MKSSHKTRSLPSIRQQPGLIRLHDYPKQTEIAEIYLLEVAAHCGAVLLNEEHQTAGAFVGVDDCGQLVASIILVVLTVGSEGLWGAVG